MECAQLVKANSIEGCKKKEVYVVRTDLCTSRIDSVVQYRTVQDRTVQCSTVQYSAVP